VLSLGHSLAYGANQISTKSGGSAGCRSERTRPDGSWAAYDNPVYRDRCLLRIMEDKKHHDEGADTADGREGDWRFVEEGNLPLSNGRTSEKACTRGCMGRIGRTVWGRDQAAEALQASLHRGPGVGPGGLSRCSHRGDGNRRDPQAIPATGQETGEAGGSWRRGVTCCVRIIRRDRPQGFRSPKSMHRARRGSAESTHPTGGWPTSDTIDVSWMTPILGTMARPCCVNNARRQKFQLLRQFSQFRTVLHKGA
jgi:hypothetical protein